MKPSVLAILIAPAVTLLNIHVVVGQRTNILETPPSETLPSRQTLPHRGKRDTCRLDAQKQHLRGAARIDSVEICVMQSRLDCLKEAIAQKVAVKTRREYIKGCIGE